MAALYDNGTSLGCGTDQVGLQRCFDDDGNIREEYLAQRRRKGRHHVRLREQGKRGALFEEICQAFLNEYPQGSEYFDAAAAVSIDAVRTFMQEVAATLALPEPYTLSPLRQQHIFAILRLGIQRINNVLQAHRA